MTGQTNQRIDRKRLWDSLMAMAEIGATPKGGVRRLALTEPDRRGRDRFRAACEAAGLTVRIDAIGNMFARRAGRDPTRAPVLFGSHLDSQPSGGKFDGALGVLAGLEVMHTLNDLGIVTEAPLDLVNWTDEEGSRFGHSLMGSGVWAGRYALDTVQDLADVEGITVRAALDGIGYRGPETAAAFPADAYFELHIEQGPILEREGRQIGIVTGAQALVWYDAVATGQDSHAGTTPPSVRKDALVCTARIIDLVDRMMRARGENGRGTVGQLLVCPNSRNVIPGEVRFSVEFRHPDGAELDRLDAQFPREAGFVARDCGVSLALTRLFKIPAQPFDPGCVDLVRQAAARLGYSAREIVSGAGHDAVYVAGTVPAAMIFVPCKDGLSHNEAESILPEQADAGCQVLFEAVLTRANRAHSVP
jgi:N-carbamoyl-L-amino-acid hydrolase